MENEIKNNSCWKNENESTGTVDKNIYCPICKGTTESVGYRAVKHFVIDPLKDKINEEEYYICLKEDCDVVYFTEAGNEIYKIQDMKTPIWFKKDAAPKYICYCNHVTEKQIIDAVLYEDAKNMKDIIGLTGAMKNANCEKNNPLGKCCSPVIQDTIRKGLKAKNDISHKIW